MSKKQDKARAGMLAGLTAGHQQAEIDKRQRADTERGRSVALLALKAISQRSTDTRPPRAEHVLALAESIGAIGLVQPPAVDQAGRLIAGLHRLEACRLLLLSEKNRLDHWQTLAGHPPGDEDAQRIAALPAPEALPEPLKSGQVPVRRLVELDAEASPHEALAAEAAENTARHAYTKAEVKELVARLRKAGYREATGRPKRGQRALRPAIELVLGVSRNTARRMLGTLEGGKVAHVGTFSEVIKAAGSLERAMTAYIGKAEELPAGQRLPNARNRLKTCRSLLRMAEEASAELKALEESHENRQDRGPAQPGLQFEPAARRGPAHAGLRGPGGPPDVLGAARRLTPLPGPNGNGCQGPGRANQSRGFAGGGGPSARGAARGASGGLENAPKRGLYVRLVSQRTYMRRLYG